jgi:hypothetical protein
MDGETTVEGVRGSGQRGMGLTWLDLSFLMFSIPE